MYLPLLAIAVAGATVVAVADATGSTYALGAGDEPTLIGQALYASGAPIERWAHPVRAEDVALERLGRIAGVVGAPDGRPEALIIAVGGLWGLGAEQVEVDMERVHLLETEGGGTTVVIDLSV